MKTTTAPRRDYCPEITDHTQLTPSERRTVSIALRRYRIAIRRHPMPY